ncbi:MAG: DUF5362 domain-containing protein [Bacteroidetes bacterium]|nr:DUF5362 domain-containing protein [Bacteroidota bacterium]
MENTQDQNMLIREIASPLYNGKGWMKFLGILSIIYGVFLALTIIGILIAWLPIWLGILIYNAAVSCENAYMNGDKYSLMKSMQQLQNYFVINGVLALVGIVFTAIALGLGLISTIYQYLNFY